MLAWAGDRSASAAPAGRLPDGRAWSGEVAANGAGRPDDTGQDHPDADKAPPRAGHPCRRSSDLGRTRCSSLEARGHMWHSVMGATSPRPRRPPDATTSSGTTFVTLAPRWPRRSGQPPRSFRHGSDTPPRSPRSFTSTPPRTATGRSRSGCPGWLRVPGQRSGPQASSEQLGVQLST